MSTTFSNISVNNLILTKSKSENIVPGEDESGPLIVESFGDHSPQI